MTKKDEHILAKVDRGINIKRAKNRASLKPIIEPIIFCGEQKLPLRENDDHGKITLQKPNHEDGKFRALIRY